MAACDPEDSPPRSASRLIFDRDIGPFILARMLSSVGIWTHNVVAAIVVYQMTRSVSLVALVSIAQFGPQFVLAPLGGVMADRWGRVRQAALGRLAAGAGGIGLAGIVFLRGVEALEARHVIIAALVVGVGFATSMPALHALVPSLGRPAELPTIVALDTMPATIARAVGPAVGGILLVAVGPAWAFLFAAMSQVLFGFAVMITRYRPVDRSAVEDHSLLGGVRHLRLDPVVAWMLLGVMGVGLGIDPAVTLAPALAEEFGAGGGMSAALTVSFGAGSVLTALAIGPLRRRWPVLHDGRVGLTVLAVALALVALSPSPEWAVALLALAGLGMFLGVTGYTTGIQSRLPEHLRGRLMALWSVAFLGSRPIAATINGLVADASSVQAAFLAMAGLLGIIAVSGWYVGGKDL